MKSIISSKILLSLKTIIIMAVMCILFMMLTGCSITDYEESYSNSVDDLLNKNFYSLDESLKDGTQRVRIMFEDASFKIEEDNYAVDPVTGNHQYLHTLNIFGSITHKYNTEEFQVVEFYINNFVAPGYKYYRIKNGNYNNIDCYMLVEMQQQQYWNTGTNRYSMEWVEWFAGDTTYLLEY